MKNHVYLLAFLCAAVLLSACKNENKEVIVTREIGPGSTGQPDRQVKIVEDFYSAITGRDSVAMMELMDERARMYGTDPTEDWGYAEMAAYIGEKSRDTTRKAVFKVKKREVRILNEMMVVVDVVDVSTIGVPFRIVTVTEKKKDIQKIVLAEFSALVWNEDMSALEQLFKAHGK